MKKMFLVLIVFMLIGFMSEGMLAYAQPTSQYLVEVAWNCYKNKDYANAMKHIELAQHLYGSVALSQQNALNSLPDPNSADFYKKTWALNDVATAYFIASLTCYRLGNIEEAKKWASSVVTKLFYAQAKDGKASWEVAIGAKKVLFGIENKVDPEKITSQLLVTNAWNTLNATNYEKAKVWAKGVIDFYSKDALKQQQALNGYPNPNAPDFYQKTWALNDVAVGYFILAKSMYKTGNSALAKSYCNVILKKYFYAQVKDYSNNTSWKVSDAAKYLIYCIDNGLPYAPASLTDEQRKMIDKKIQLQESQSEKNKQFKVPQKEKVIKKTKAA